MVLHTCINIQTVHTYTPACSVVLTWRCVPAAGSMMTGPKGVYRITC